MAYLTWMKGSKASMLQRFDHLTVKEAIQVLRGYKQLEEMPKGTVLKKKET